jgi:uncharacterized protein (DUF305 family)
MWMMKLFSRAAVYQRAISLATIMTLSVSSFALAQSPTMGHHAADALMQMAMEPSGLPSEAPFLSENDAAMAKMMADMEVAPTGDIDRDFVAMMVPHHQGAIDMAKAVLRYGKNEQVRRLAQEIIVTQQQEIAAMRLAVDEPLPPSAASPTQPPPEANPDQPSMRDNTSQHSASHDSMKMK